MPLLKIANKRDLSKDIILKFKNKENICYFICENNFFSLFFGKSEKATSHSVHSTQALAHIFAHEIVKFFQFALPGGLLELENISLHEVELPSPLEESDIDICAEEINIPVRISASSLFLKEINGYILNKNLQNTIPKVTGFSAYQGQLAIENETYDVIFQNHLRTIGQPKLFCKISLFIEDSLVDFYLPEKIICYFSTLVLPQTNKKKLPLTNMLCKIFAELFLVYLDESLHISATLHDVHLQYVKNTDLLEINLKTSENQFEIFAHTQAKNLILKYLTNLNFEKLIQKNEKPSLEKQLMPFALELGVSYLSHQETQNISVGDIILFDKTCLSADNLVVDKCVINLNGLSLVASLQEEQLQVTHVTKDW